MRAATRSSGSSRAPWRPARRRTRATSRWVSIRTLVRADGADEHALLAGGGDDRGGVGYVDHDDVGLRQRRVQRRTPRRAAGRARGPRPAGRGGGRARRARPRRARRPGASRRPSACAYARLGDLLGRAEHQRADRGAEALGEADRHRVGDRAVRRQRRPRRDVGVPDARAVDVHAAPELVRERRAAPRGRRAAAPCRRRSCGCSPPRSPWCARRTAPCRARASTGSRRGRSGPARRPRCGWSGRSARRARRARPAGCAPATRRAPPARARRARRARARWPSTRSG